MQRTHETSNNRLQKVFLALSESRLVKEKNVNTETIDEFSKLLAVAYPDIAQAGDIVRGMMHHNKPAFYKYLHITEQRYLVLACDGGAIAGMLGIRDIVTIKWNREDSCYIVGAIDSSYNRALYDVNNPNSRKSKPSKYDKNKKPKHNRRVVAPPSPALELVNVETLPPHVTPPPTISLLQSETPSVSKSAEFLDTKPDLPSASWADF